MNKKVKSKEKPVADKTIKTQPATKNTQKTKSVIYTEEKAKRASALVVAKAEKAKRAAEIVIANAEKAIRAAGLVIATLEKEKNADELIIAGKELTYQNEEKVKNATESFISDVNKTKREAELVIENIEKANRRVKSIIAGRELNFQTGEKLKPETWSVIAEVEKTNREIARVIANIRQAKRSGDLVIVNVEKAKNAAELVIASKELFYQKSEKSKRAAELIIAKVLKAKRAAELIIGHIEKARRAAEFVIASRELQLVKEKEKLIEELKTINEELTNQIEKRIQSEESLKESNEKYSVAFQSSQYAIALMRVEDGRLIDVNDAFSLTLGYSKEEALSISTVGLNMWGDIEERKWVMSTLLSGSDVEGKELLFKKKSGEIITGLFSAKTINVKNEPCIIFNISDISDRKKAEKTLQDIIDNNPLAIQILDKDGFTLKVNQAFLLLYGSIPPLDYSMFNDKQLNEKGFGKLIDHIKNAEVVHFPDMTFNPHDSVPVLPDFPVWIRTIVFPLVDGNGKPEKFVFLHENITEKKQAEDSLRQSYAFSETLLKTIPFGMDIVDETGTVLFQSDIFKKIFGEHTIGQKCWGLYCDDKKQCIDCPLIGGITVGETETYESHGVFGNRIFDIIHTGMIYQGRKAMLEIFQDITERKQTESELIKAKEKAEESDRLKSAFLTNMSHEIRTPMNGILGFAELLKEPSLTIDEQQDYIQTMQISGARMLNTINSIVDMSKIESGLIGIDIKEANVNEKIEFTYKFFKPEVEIKGLQFLFKNGLPANETNIKTDNEKVYAILTNLVRNAIKFTFNGSIEFGYEKNGEYLKFFVKDTGIGIPEKQQQLVFERFRQGSESHNRGYEGSGLGLSICKSYVEMLGGRIWVESEEGLGSTFYFTIPYNPVSEETSAVENVVDTENKEVQVEKLKILIVEDDEISYSLLTRFVQKYSKEVLHAVTGIEAVEACRNNPDFDLVLMDIRMPGMNGLEATQKIRQFNKDVVIIAQTAYGFSGDKEKALDAGCNDYISKPINKTLLYELIIKHFNK